MDLLSDHFARAFVATERQESINRSLCHDATQAGFRARQRSLAHTWYRRNQISKNCPMSKGF